MIQRPDTRILYAGDVDVRQPIDVAATTWYNPDGATPGGPSGTCLGAWRALGAESFAASLVNQANPGTYDGVSGGAVTWWKVYGWQIPKNNANAYIHVGLVPVVGGTFICRFSGAPTFNVCCLGGCYDVSTGDGMWLWSNLFGAGTHHFANGHIDSWSGVAPPLASGTMAVSGQKGYINGVPQESFVVPEWSEPPAVSFSIGLLRFDNGSHYQNPLYFPSTILFQPAIYWNNHIPACN